MMSAGHDSLFLKGAGDGWWRAAAKSRPHSKRHRRLSHSTWPPCGRFPKSNAKAVFSAECYQLNIYRDSIGSPFQALRDVRKCLSFLGDSRPIIIDYANNPAEASMPGLRFGRRMFPLKLDQECNAFSIPPLRPESPAPRAPGGHRSAVAPGRCCGRPACCDPAPIGAAPSPGNRWGS